MKKLSLILIIVLMFSITACNGGNENPTTSNHDGQNSTVNAICTHDWTEATCNEAKKCTKCGEVSGVALGHTTDSGICYRCNENLSSWEIGEYVDEFKEPTGKKYMIADTIGTFSNSATSGSTLNASLQIDIDNIGIMLWEYGSNLVKGTSDYEEYNITILDESGTKHYFTGIIYKGGTRVYFYEDDRSAVISLLRKNDKVKIYLKSSKYSISTYLFTIDTTGFDTIYSSII